MTPTRHLKILIHVSAMLNISMNLKGYFLEEV